MGYFFDHIQPTLFAAEFNRINLLIVDAILFFQIQLEITPVEFNSVIISPFSWDWKNS